MKFPKINKQPSRSVTVPKLSGGINMRDAVTMVQDNQLTDSKNMWYKDNILKTRPGTEKLGVLSYDEYNPTINAGHTSTYSQKENATKVINGALCQLMSRRTDFKYLIETGGNLYDSVTRIQFFWVGKGSSSIISELPPITSDNYVCYKNSFVIQDKKELYCFCETENGGDIFKLSDGDSAWVKVEDNGKDIYAPLVMTHCKSTDHLMPSESQILDAGGVMFEGYNLLSGYYRMIWSTYNNSIALPKSESDPTKVHWMLYGLLHSVRDFVGKTVTVKITNQNGSVYTHSLTVNNEPGWQKEQTDRGDGIYLGVFRKALAFFPSPSSSTFAYITENDYVEDNMEITAPCPNSVENLKKVFSMQKNIWFGGDAAGISGGTRLFLGGNAEEKEKSLVLWSRLNNPLYFPENCYAYVGNSNQAVTAFGRQNDTLVIFKERETFYTQYTRNSDITASDLINQNVVDYTASSVYFPIIQLHSAIGCDSPDTVELCRNRLVWACTDGSVYTLITENQYSERNIYCLSDMIKRRLKNENALEYARSCDWNGHYLLFVASHVYVMNYESYGYAYASSYNKTEDAQVMIPWWYWEMPFSGSVNAAFVSGNSPTFVFGGIYDYDEDINIYLFDEGIFTDVGGDIPSMFLTKIFDFGMPHYFKNVPLINMAFGNNGGEPISVSFVTEQGEEQGETVTLSESNKDEYSPEYVHNRQLRPCVRLINRIGVKAECEGAMSVDSISLDYRALGGAK
nr:MAG TPA: stabilization protein [Caudoviricetes sp.]